MQNQNINQRLNQNNQINNMLNNPTQDNNLQMVLFKKNNGNIEAVDTGNLSFEDNFSWFVDSEGKMIDFNQKVNAFDGVKLMHNFLEKRYGLNKDTVSDVKISEFLSIFAEGKDVTVLDLFNHVHSLYLEDKESFMSLIKDLGKESSESISQDLKNIFETFLQTSNPNEPLGEFGRKTLNEVILDVKNLNWDVLYNNIKLTMNVIPMATFAVGYGLTLRAYHKIDSLQKCPSNFSAERRAAFLLEKNRKFFVFSVIAAPVMVCLFKITGVAYKDIFQLEFVGSNEDKSAKTVSDTTKFSSVFLLFNKLPNYIKIFIRLLFIRLLELY